MPPDKELQPWLSPTSKPNARVTPSLSPLKQVKKHAAVDETVGNSQTEATTRKGKAPACLPALPTRKGSGIGSSTPEKSIIRDASSPGTSYRITKPTIASSQRLKLGTSAALVVKASKLGTAEKNRRARHNEDNRLVEEAKRQAAVLIDQARRVSAMNHKEMIRDQRRTEMAKGAVGKATLPPKTSTTHKKQSSYDERGRTMERENSGKRSLLKTDSPKPHIGRNRPLLATSEASKATPAERPLNAHVNTRPRVTAKPTTRTVEKQLEPRTNTATFSKQRSSGLVRESPRRASWRLGQSSASRSEERKKAIIDSAMRTRASAPSPEEHSFVANDPKPRLKSMSTAADESLVDKLSASRTPFCSPISTPDLLEDLRAINQTPGNVRPTRYESSSWVAPVFRPKTRRDRDKFEPSFRPRPIPPTSVRRYKDQREEAIQGPILAKSTEQSRQSSTIMPTAIEKINVEEDLTQAMTALTLSENSSADAPNQSKPASPHHDHSYLVSAENISLPDSEAISGESVRGWNDAQYNSDNMLSKRIVPSPELSPSNLRAENMSPIDMAQAVRQTSSPLGVAKAMSNQGRKKVSTGANFSYNAEKMSLPFRLEGGDITENGLSIAKDIDKPILEAAEASQDPTEIEIPTRCDLQNQSLVGIDAKTDAPQNIIDSPSKSKEKSLQPDVAFSPSSPSSRIPLPKEKFKRGGIKDIQWETVLPVRLKDIPAKDELNLFDISSSSTGIDIRSEPVKDVPDTLSNSETLPQTKALASCLTNSRRGRGLHVSFASSEEEGLYANIGVCKGSEVPAQHSSNGSDNFRDGKSKGPETSVFPIAIDVIHVKSYTAPEMSHTASHRGYERRDYERAKKGLRKAVIAGNLLLEKSSLLKPKRYQKAENFDDSNSELLNHAVSYIMAVKKQFLDRPEVYHDFLATLETLPRKDLITPEQAKRVDTEVAKLLASAPDLVERFKMFRPSNIRDDEESSENAKVPASSTVVAKDANTNQRNTIVDSFKNIAHQENDDEHMQRLIESLRLSAKGLCYKPSQTRSTVPRTKKEYAKYNPAAPEFKPLVGASLPPQTIPQPHQRGGFVSLNQDNQIADAGAANNHGPILASNEIRGVAGANGYHTMPVRTRNRQVEASLKKEVLAAEMAEPLPLKEPMKMNGTTFYTLPNAAILPNEVPLAGAATADNKEEFKVAFSAPVPPVYHGPFNSHPRNPHFGRNSQVPPLWMRTPLVPIRKPSGSKLAALHTDASAGKKSIDEHGIEVKRLDDETAKMKLDDFISRFPMTGRKAHVVPNMKQKYAAEIQHRLELVLYEKKEKEAAARKLLMQGLVDGTL